MACERTHASMEALGCRMEGGRDLKAEILAWRMLIIRREVLPALLGLVLAAQDPPPQLAVEQIVGRMVRADESKVAALGGYTGMRRYRLENKRVNKRAEIVVRFTCTRTGARTFEVVSESGSAFVRNHVLRKVIDAETESSQKNDREQSRILPKNYDFRLIGTDTSEGRPSYLLDLIPKTKNKFLIQGRLWVDAEDYAITRIEGSPARNPSFWIKSVKIVHRYGKTGPFWLPVKNSSWAEARVFGPIVVTIEYFDYVVTDLNTGRPSVEDPVVRPK